MRLLLLLATALKCTYSFRGPALAPLATPPRSHSIIAPRAAAVAIEADADAPLPRALLPVTLSVFAQMIGEGIAIATLPLHLTRLGAKPVEVALATSFFSVAQMVCCPLLVRRSGGAGGRRSPSFSRALASRLQRAPLVIECFARSRRRRFYARSDAQR